MLTALGTKISYTNRGGISESTSATFSRIYLPISFFIHFSLIVFVSTGLGRQSQSSPLGIQRLGEATVVEIGENLYSRKKSEVSGDINSGDVPIHRKKRKKAEISEEFSTEEKTGARFGVQKGVIAEGPLGVANGKATSEKERYVYELRMLLEGRKTYPRLARQMREEGKVLLHVEILSNGEIRTVQIKEPSSYKRLNEAAVHLVSEIRQYRPIPKTISEASLRIEIPIEYTLK